MPKIANKIDTDVRGGLMSAQQLITEITKDKEIFAGATGDLTSIVQEYESLTGALNSLLGQALNSQSEIASNSFRIDGVIEAVA